MGRRTPSVRWPMASLSPMPMPLAIPTMSALSPELATLATEEASMESARLTPTPSDKSLTGFPWPMLTPPDTLTTLALSPESASPATGTGMEQESTTASARLRRTIGQVAYGGARGVVTGVDYGYGHVAGYGAVGNRGL